MLSGVWPGVSRKRRTRLPEADLLAVAHRAVREGRAGLLAEDDRGARPRRELPVAAHEVRVEVRLDDPLDREALRARLVHVLVDVAPRVHDGGFAAVADQVRRVRETAEVELLEIHRRRA